MTDAAGTAATGAATTTAAGDQGAATGDQGAAGTTTATTTAAGAGQAAQAGAAQAGAQGQQQAAAGDLDWSAAPPELRAEYERLSNRNHELQRERGNERINAKTEARNEGALNAVRDLAKSLGLELPGDEVTVEGVQAELQTVTTRADGAARAAAVTEAAWEHDVDRGQREYLDFLVSKDTSLPAPSDPEFAAKVSAAVASLVAAHPTLRRSGTAAAAGVENHGGANGNDSTSQEKFDAMTLGERSKLYLEDPDTYNRLTGRA